MGDRSRIEWTDATWNPVRGCSRVSEGCRNCYAERVAGRFSGPGGPYEGLIAKGGQWNGQIRLVDDHLTQPLRWQRPRRVFVNSMSDLFHPGVPHDYVDQVFAVMALARRHTFQVLTKRPERLLDYMRSADGDTAAAVWMRAVELAGGATAGWGWEWPLPNVWIGVSVEDQATADERIPQLLEAPAAVRWISAEPLLGPIWLRWWQCACGVSMSQTVYQANGGNCRNCGLEAGLLWERWPLDWVVAGGESGPGARPSHPDWFRSLRDQCAQVPSWAAGSRLTGDPIPFLFKQWGEYKPGLASSKMVRVGKKRAGRELDGRIHDEYPA